MSSTLVKWSVDLPVIRPTNICSNLTKLLLYELPVPCIHTMHCKCFCAGIMVSETYSIIKVSVFCLLQTMSATGRQLHGGL